MNYSVTTASEEVRQHHVLRGTSHMTGKYIELFYLEERICAFVRYFFERYSS